MPRCLILGNAYRIRRADVDHIHTTGQTGEFQQEEQISVIGPALNECIVPRPVREKDGSRGCNTFGPDQERGAGIRENLKRIARSGGE